MLLFFLCIVVVLFFLFFFYLKLNLKFEPRKLENEFHIMGNDVVVVANGTVNHFDISPKFGGNLNNTRLPLVLPNYHSIDQHNGHQLRFPRYSKYQCPLRPNKTEAPSMVSDPNQPRNTSKQTCFSPGSKNIVPPSSRRSLATQTLSAG